MLHAAAVLDQNLPRLWQVRCEIHAQACGARGEKNDAQAWAWTFPEDLGDRGWEADLRLWRRCMGERAREGWPPSLPDPAVYLATLRTCHEPEQLLAMARSAGRAWAADEGCDDLVDLLGAALDEGARAGRTLGRRIRAATYLQGDGTRKGVPAACFDRARAVLQCLVALRTHPHGPALAGSFARWVGKRMPYEQGLDLLGALRDLGVSEATVELARFASDVSDIERKQQALALLMRPPSGSLLAPRASTNTGASSSHGETIQ